MIINTIIKSTTLSSQPPRTTAIVVDGADLDVNKTSAAVIKTNPPPIAAPMTTPQIPGSPRTPPQIARETTVIMASAIEPNRRARCSGTRGSSKLQVLQPSPFKESLTLAHSTTARLKLLTHWSRFGHYLQWEHATASTLRNWAYLSASEWNYCHPTGDNQGHNSSDSCYHRGHDRVTYCPKCDRHNPQIKHENRTTVRMPQGQKSMVNMCFIRSEWRFSL